MRGIVISEVATGQQKQRENKMKKLNEKISARGYAIVKTRSMNGAATYHIMNSVGTSVRRCSSVLQCREALENMGII
jgi:malate/lactate dehydrogenase